MAIDAAFVDRARTAVDAAFEREIALGKVEPLSTETSLSIIAIVGEHMKSHPGISGKMFGAMGRNGVNVRAIAQGSSERNISAVISTADVKKAVNILHEEFFETTYRQVNLFVAGTGNVGRRLFAQLQQQSAFLLKTFACRLELLG